MNHPWRRVLALGGWVVVMGAAAWCHTRSTSRVAVLALPVEAAADDDGNLPSPAGPPVASGTRCRVPAGQCLVLSLVPGVTAQLEAGTDFSVGELAVRQVGTVVEERRARLTLHGGKGFFAVASPPDRQVSLGIVTPSGTAEAQPGTAFCVAVDGANTRIVCAWGGIRWREERGEPPKGMVLLAGEFRDGASFAADGPAVRQVAEFPAVQDEMAALLRFGPRVNALQARRRGEISFRVLKGR